MNKLRSILIICFALEIVILVLMAVTIAPLNRTVDRGPLIEKMDERIDNLDPDTIGSGSFSVGYAKENLTPGYKTATAGYGKRLGREYTSVHDSIYVRTLVVDNGRSQVAIVSADLLIIPPEVTERLKKELPEIGFSLDNTYLGAIHSHNSIGNWGKGATSILYGSYDDSIVNFITAKIKTSILKAAASTQRATIKSGAIPVPHGARNRLIKTGAVDSLLRVVRVTRADSSRIILMNFTAHATCLFSRDLELSRDYPGQLVDKMEAEGYAFAMFMAGSVGSHSADVPEQGWKCVDDMATKLSKAVADNENSLSTVGPAYLSMKRVPLDLGEPQVKVFHDWRFRPWIFKLAFGDYPVYLTGLRIGDLIWVGTPCDFSGEFDNSIDSLARRNGLRAMITSFNGGYIGYVTPTNYYDVNHYETQLMNWYGPGNSEYVKRCVEKLLLKMGGNTR